MTWLTPLVAAVAAAIAVPSLIILYFLKLRRREVEVSTTLLWKKAVQDLQANAPFQRLRRNILLLLQLLVLAAALFAVGQPELEGKVPRGLQHVILIDRSASMSSTDADGGVSRLDAAKREAVRLVDSLRGESLIGSDRADEAMVIAFDQTAEVRQQFTGDKAALKAAINAIEPTAAPSSLDEAVRLARAHLPDQTLVEETGAVTVEGLKTRGVALHLFSDGRLPDARRVLTGVEDKVRFTRLGTPDAANLAVTAFRAERTYDNPTELTVFIGIQSTDRAERRAELELIIDGVVERIRPVTIPPATTDAPTLEDGTPPPPDLWRPGTTSVVFRLERPDGGLFAVRLLPGDGPDVLDIDNRAWLVVPPARQLSVAVVTEGSLFLVSALQGLPLAKLVQYTPDEYLAASRRGETGAYDVVVLDAWLPPPGDRPTLPPGRYLVLGAVPPPPLGAADLGPGEPGILIDWRRDHPALRGLVLDNVVVSTTRNVEIGPESAITVIAETDRGPAILDLASADLRAVIVAFNPADSYWPFYVSFPVFVAQALNYLGQDPSHLGLDARSVRPGSVLTDRLPQGADAVSIRLPDRTEISLTPAADGRIVYGPVRQAGVHEVTWRGERTPADITVGARALRPFAASLLDPEESDAGASSSLSLAGVDVAALDPSRSNVNRRLWPWLLLAALGVMTLEWFVYNRKVQI
ncbi:MAG: VWA domain-containing protein [Phycisphaeraceae bacterium]|nr:VWA domain-containing protein [Phycisphaeraceae bacterium]